MPSRNDVPHVFVGRPDWPALLYSADPQQWPLIHRDEATRRMLAVVLLSDLEYDKSLFAGVDQQPRADAPPRRGVST